MRIPPLLKEKREGEERALGGIQRVGKDGKRSGKRGKGEKEKGREVERWQRDRRVRREGEGKMRGERKI